MCGFGQRRHRKLTVAGVEIGAVCWRSVCAGRLRLLDHIYPGFLSHPFCISVLIELAALKCKRSYWALAAGYEPCLLLFFNCLKTFFFLFLKQKKAGDL